jgi:polyphosphate kinase
LLVAPKSLKREILRRITREIKVHRRNGDGYLAFKLNGLEDKDIIKALYVASREGVKIDLNVRGLCCLRPGVKGVSENISVISIVGRFLEHARVYYFRNDLDEETLLGSSDMMFRNLNKRVEVLFSVPDPEIKQQILDNILFVHLNDNVKSWRLLPDGSYEKVVPEDGSERINSQEWLIENRGIWHGSRA